MEHNQSLKELREKVAQLEEELASKNEVLRNLKETEVNFRLLADHTNDALFIIDADQQLTFINPAAKKLYGFTEEELKNIPFEQRYTQESVQRIWSAVKEHREHLERGETDRKPFTLELQHYHKNGGLVDLETIISPVYDEDGAYRCAIGVARDITKRKKMEQSLHLHSAAINQIKDLITVTDLDGFIIYVNDAECLARGKAREELIGQHVSIYGKGSAAEEKSEDIIHKSVQNGFWRGEIENIGRDGNILTLDYRIQAIRDETGNVFGLCGLGTDISERKRTEEKLRQNHILIDMTSRMAKVGGWQFDVASQQVRWTDETYRIHEKEQSEEYVDLEEAFNFFHPDDRPILKNAFNEAVNQGKPYDLELRLITSKGKKKWTHTICKPEKIDGNVVKLHGSFQDITEQKHFQQKLQENANELNWLFKSMINAFVVFDSVFDENGTFISYRFVYINDAFGRITGVKNEEVLGKTVHEVWPGTEQSWVERYGAAAVTGITQTFEMYHEPTKKLYYCNVYRPWETKDRFCVIFEDITERKQLEENLRQAQKMETVGTLAGGVAHEFNNIIGGMMGYAEVAKETVAEESPTYNYLNDILSLGTRADDVVKQMLAFSRKASIEKIPHQIHLSVKEQLKLLRNIIPSKIEIKTAIDESAGTVMADPTQMQQICINLCNNAVQAMEPGGGVLKIRLSTVYLNAEAVQSFQDIKPGRYVKLTVSDTGGGIPREIIDRIYDPFFTTKGINEGTGLGLSVVDGILREHGGAIGVESTPGSGTVFSVYLPVIGNEQAEAPADEKDDITGGTERILIVDDEEFIFGPMKIILERLGYRVTALSSSIEALEKFKKSPNQFDLIITDLTMPGITGDNLAVEALAVRPDLPVILMTGYNDMCDSEKVKKSGIKAFMPKPCKKSDLAGTIRRVLDGQ